MTGMPSPCARRWRWACRAWPATCARGREGRTLFQAGQRAGLAQAVRDALVAGPAKVVAPDAGPVMLDVYAALLPAAWRVQEP